MRVETKRAQARPALERGSVARIEGDIHIQRPPEVVFDFVADERNEPRYNSRMTTARLVTSEPIGVGSRFEATLSRGGRAFKMNVEFVKFERPRELASVTTTGPLNTVGALTFAPEGEGTRMRWAWNIELRGAMRLFTPVVVWMGRRQERSNWARLKALLELTD